MPGGNVPYWFYQYNNEWVGPFTRAEIPQLAEDGRLTPMTPVLFQGSQFPVLARDSAIRSYIPGALEKERSAAPVVTAVFAVASLILLCVIGSIASAMSYMPASDSGGNAVSGDGAKSGAIGILSFKSPFEQLYDKYRQKIDDITDPMIKKIRSGDADSYWDISDAVDEADEKLYELSDQYYEEFDVTLEKNDTDENEEAYSEWYDKLEEYRDQASERMYDELYALEERMDEEEY